jgi:hypothetical protein
MHVYDVVYANSVVASECPLDLVLRLHKTDGFRIISTIAHSSVVAHISLPALNRSCESKCL